MVAATRGVAEVGVSNNDRKGYARAVASTSQTLFVTAAIFADHLLLAGLKQGKPNVSFFFLRLHGAMNWFWRTQAKAFAWLCVAVRLYIELWFCRRYRKAGIAT